VWGYFPHCIDMWLITEQKNVGAFFQPEASKLDKVPKYLVWKY